MQKNQYILLFRTASWVITLIFVALFIFKVVRLSQIKTTFGSLAQSPAYLFGVSLAYSIIPSIMWIITIVPKKRKKSQKGTNSSIKDDESQSHKNNSVYTSLSVLQEKREKDLKLKGTEVNTIAIKQKNNGKNVLDVDNELNQLQELKTKGLLTSEEYDVKVLEVQNQQAIKRKEKQQENYEKRLAIKSKRFLDLLIDARANNLLSEDEYSIKEEEVLNRCKKEIEYEDNCRPQVTDIPTKIFGRETTNEQKGIIFQLFEIMEFGDVIAYNIGASADDDERINLFGREDWQEIIDSESANKYEIILKFDEAFIKL